MKSKNTIRKLTNSHKSNLHKINKLYGIVPKTHTLEEMKKERLKKCKIVDRCK